MAKVEASATDPYWASWIKVLQGDKRAIVSAAAHAERTVRVLQRLRPQEAAP